MMLDNTSGENNRNSKLTEEQVHRIRAEYDKGLRGKYNAPRYGIKGETYNTIGRRQSWRKLPERGR